MTTATRPSLYLTGHCGIGNHDACRGLYAGVCCTCRCHTPEPADALASSAEAALPQVLAAPGEGSSIDLGDALQHLRLGVTALDSALPSFDGQDIEVLDLLGRVRHERQQLAQLESLIENQAARAMQQDVIEWPGGTAERRHGRDRKEWKHDELTSAITAAIVPALAVDPSTGEVDRDLAALLHEAVTQYAATNRPIWRVTAVKPLGIDPDDFCASSPGRPTVAVSLKDVA